MGNTNSLGCSSHVSTSTLGHMPLSKGSKRKTTCFLFTCLNSSISAAQLHDAVLLSHNPVFTVQALRVSGPSSIRNTSGLKMIFQESLALSEIYMPVEDIENFQYFYFSFLVCMILAWDEFKWRNMVKEDSYN